MSDAQPKRWWQGKAFRMILVLVAVAVVFSGVLEAVDLATKETIERNFRIKMEQGVLSVLGFDTSGDFSGRFQEVIETRQFPRDGRAFTVFVGKKDGQIVGYAVHLIGGGFQGVIDFVLGFTPDLKRITAMEVITTGETPGLGGEMITCKPEFCFKDEFAGLATEPQVEFIKYLDPEKPNQFKALTGATFTSTAIRDMINRALVRLRALAEAGELGP